MNSNPQVIAGMRNPYLFGFLGATFLGCSVVLVVYWQYRWLPAPEHANLNQLFYWLVTRDLHEYPPEVRRTLLTRLEEQASLARHAAVLSQDDSIELPTEYRERLESNAALLRDDWFSWQLESYEACPVERRSAFLTRCLDSVDDWCRFRQRLGESDSAGEMVELVEGLTREVPPGRSALANQLIADAVVVWLTRVDLDEFDFELRRDLALRIAAALDEQGQSSELPAEGWSPEQQQSLRRNGQLLMEAWVREQAAELAGLSDAEQSEFVELQIAKVQRWGVLGWLLDDPGSASAEQESLGWAGLLKLNQMLAAWIERAPETERAGLTNLVKRVRQQLLVGPRGGGP